VFENVEAPKTDKGPESAVRLSTFRSERRFVGAPLTLRPFENVAPPNAVRLLEMKTAFEKDEIPATYRVFDNPVGPSTARLECRFAAAP